ncbi:ABC transporter ATP-binding protein [Phaeacidiphilus oryzae]|uniref:ABC transporter ATP-binding protein n=1 Tax=Phaeacidiphilus oryzae TaxID=348818 RepID=UPI000A0630F0|nr:ATP-binding cassette domain-containing protein [Phaeacidiphilus oryzae]
MSERVLEVDRLSKRFGAVQALDGMAFDVRAGELFGFVGSNGAGKTTTMRIMLGVLAPDAGEVRWDGRPLDEAARARIGYMPEERGLYPRMRVGEQLEYLARIHGFGRAAAARAAEEWTERLGVAARRGDEVQKLSLGNQQRVQLAAALVHDPEVLVLDEPFSGLDPVAVDVLAEVLRERARAGAPVIFSSHQLELVERLCDRVGIVRAGRMVACGPVGELRSEAGERLLVDAPEAPAGWAAGLPGVTVLEEEAGRTLLELAPGADDQAVLKAALGTGPVREFARHRPGLAELFRHVVAEGGGVAGATGLRRVRRVRRVRNDRRSDGERGTHGKRGRGGRRG